MVTYETGDGKIRYQIPQILSVGHNFEDLTKRISSWQRTQVWEHTSDCKNQLHKIFDVIAEIDLNLRKNIPEVYPKFVEISTKTIDVTSLVSEPIEITISFANKQIAIKPSYDTNFYHNYSNKALTFSKSVSSPKILVCAAKTTPQITNFLQLLSNEYQLRTNTAINFEHGPLKPDQAVQYSNYDLVLTIGCEDEENEQLYLCIKQTLQNKLGVPHQNVIVENAEENLLCSDYANLSKACGGLGYCPRQKFRQSFALIVTLTQLR
jgi:hypothetical protein